MRSRIEPTRRIAAVLTAVSLLVWSSMPMGWAQSQTPPAPEGKRWPRAFTTPSGASVVIFEPQIASWANQKQLVAYAAVSCEPKGATKTELGTIKVEANTAVSLDERLVRFADFRITESNFQTLPKDQTREVVAEVEKTLPDEDRVLDLDRVLAFVDKSQIVPKNMEGLKADPPMIYYSARPAVLVNIDGDPVWSPIKDNDLKFIVNTNWDLFQHSTTSVFYLRVNDSWLKATAVTGPWAPAGDLPESFKKLPADDNWKDVKASVPGKKLDAGKAPTVFVSTKPAEMILLNGEPKYEAVAGTGLLWVSNTDSDIFRMGKTGAVYYLVTGRWFSASDFKGPWKFATLDLTPDFQKIPLEHPRSRVLASVPGTSEAAEAIMLAQIPQTARVNIKELKAPEVTYQGDPQFTPIQGTSLQQAANTDKDIIKAGDLYYMCFQGVWFMAKKPEGPWEVTTSVPKEIYEIPPSSPVHNVTYVTVEDDDDDEWATFAVMAGYTGMMVAWGCAVWGTGYYYPPYVWYGGYYPLYYPHYATYGCSAWYNPYTGRYGRSAVAYGPYGGAGYSAAYNPRTGTYSRGAAAYGPYGYRAVGEAYNPRTGAYGSTRQGGNVYGSWGSTSVQRGDDWAKTARYTNNATGNTTRVTRTDNGAAVSHRGPEGGGFAAVGDSGNVYAGHDGNVYRKQDGSWQKYDNGGWNSVERPSSGTGNVQKPTSGTGSGQFGGKASQLDSSTFSQLNRDSSARSQGAARTSSFQNYRSSGSSFQSAGSFRARSGGGGGRRRR